MAVLGAQFVFTIAMFSFLQKLSPFYSFGRWLLSGRLVRYLHPSDEELKQLAGISKAGGDKGKGRRQDYKKMLNNPKDESFQVPRNLPIQLDTAKVDPVDLVPLHFYSEYQWLADFSLCSLVVYVLTEVYLAISPHRVELNASVLWCLLALAFTLRVLGSQTSVYLRTEEGGEKVLLFTFGFFYLVLAMGTLVVGDGVLEFGLEEGYRNFSQGAQAFLQRQGVDSQGPVSFLTFQILLILACTLTGALLTFPGLRMAKLHLDTLKYHKENIALQVLLYVNYVLPLVVVLLWVKPVGRDLLCGGGAFWSNRYLSHGQFEVLRLVIVLATCLLRLLLLPLFMQSHLNLAHHKIEVLKKEPGRISSLDLQRTVARVFYYLCMVCLQYLAPVLLMLFLTLLLKTLGHHAWCHLLGDSYADLFAGRHSSSGSLFGKGGGGASSSSSPSSSSDGASDSSNNGTAAASILETAAHFAVTMGDLRAVFTPVWYRGLLSFLLWWVSAAWFISSSLGVMYYSNTMDV